MLQCSSASSLYVRIYCGNGNYTDGSGGTQRYWQQSDRENIPGEDWRRDAVGQDFAGAIVNRLGDHNARYVDGKPIMRLSLVRPIRILEEKEY
ncbi:hypothetical protein FBD94_14735 [Pedobacter hiemivivus]|uniref:Uncharacterized protein n=1 Tax=Pedobacter hiemivivus TaxID=2530454 RepID=A0A4U1G8E7_9SPHI|nr:hypothetical protein [Pedobacter hiemivivus]TKC60167.1 hypothetical protein FBD94_14735 [Pedobacter hiemivivus]